MQPYSAAFISIVMTITEFACAVFHDFISDIMDNPMEWVWADGPTCGRTNEKADVRMLTVRCLVTYE